LLPLFRAGAIISVALFAFDSEARTIASSNFWTPTRLVSHGDRFVFRLVARPGLSSQLESVNYPAFQRVEPGNQAIKSSIKLNPAFFLFFLMLSSFVFGFYCPK
jgi:hypothetical protein